MYLLLLTLHSIVRWLVLFFLLYSIIRAFRGYIGERSFTASDNAVRHWTATVAHIQLVLGMGLYVISPIVRSIVARHMESGINDGFFFRYIHIAMMLLGIVLLTIGSAKAKRIKVDKEKFRTIIIWYVLALVVILLAIPWPFSPLSQRPFVRLF
ncbi:hypothetical protein KTO58_04140 [Chitinophaga pendula]|uniref:hypothetical protein n=1 Tax=Chitinophaga TaxID=79328 RepID=UPI000BAEB18C|nr:MULTISPECIES: hypothetical protein [Chitinophaga]ASZ13989.1 hypothetical protein CK934_25060 [Chitinophaga sp. MD30]UCJ08387.1 hypothetical protein KTO58_04140 [Chitinophaga pendula]